MSYRPKRGDIVIIDPRIGIDIPRDPEDWSVRWNPKMNNLIGKQCKIIHVYDTSVIVSLVSDESDSWNFHLSHILKLHEWEREQPKSNHLK